MVQFCELLEYFDLLAQKILWLRQALLGYAFYGHREVRFLWKQSVKESINTLWIFASTSVAKSASTIYSKVESRKCFEFLLYFRLFTSEKKSPTTFRFGLFRVAGFSLVDGVRKGEALTVLDLTEKEWGNTSKLTVWAIIVIGAHYWHAFENIVEIPLPEIAIKGMSGKLRIFSRAIHPDEHLYVHTNTTQRRWLWRMAREWGY